MNREILFRGQLRLNGEPVKSKWVYGGVCQFKGERSIIYQIEPDIEKFSVYTETVGQYTGLTDKNGRKIFEGDIVQYNTIDDFDCQSIVKTGEYSQDGSSGEYKGTLCYGTYVEVNNLTYPDWCRNNPEMFPFPKYLIQQNLLEVANECRIIGNIYDNPELLRNGEKYE